MAQIAYPAYGTLMTRSYAEAPVSNITRTEFESGDIKQARRSNLIRYTRDVTYLYTDAEYETWKTWFRVTAFDGALKFDWTDPQDNVLKDGRIANGEYQARAINAQMNHWEVTFSLETLE